MKSYIIGIAGHKNAGKDTVASMVNYIFAKGITQASYGDWVINQINYNAKFGDRIIHFADNVKDVLSIIYNIPRKLFDDRQYKDELYYCLNTGQFNSYESINHGNHHNIIINIENLDECNIVDYDNNFNKNKYIKLRTLMQYFATNICRHTLGNNIWVNSCIGKAVDIAAGRRVCIISDVRFKNESIAIRKNETSLYGGIIKVNRKSDTTDVHESEQIDFDSDFIIDNNGTLIQLFYKTLEICQKIILM